MTPVEKILNKLRKHLGDYSHGTFPTTTPSYDKGGDLGELTTVKNKNGTITNVYKTKFGLITQVKTKDGKYYEKTSEYPTFEEKVDKKLGSPQKRAMEFMSKVTPKGEDGLDNVRHMSAGRYTAEELLKNARNGAIPFPDVVNKANSWVVANALGVAHEATTLFEDKRPWGIKLKEAGEDIYNNAVGVNLGLSDKTYTNKRNAIIDNSFYHKVPDGYGEYHPYHNKFVDPYELKKNKKGGMLLYKKGGALKSRIECHNPKCNHSWPREDGGNDMYICHECSTDNTKFYGKGGSIHIDKNKKGTFTAAATKHSKSVQAFASQVLANKENYSSKMVKKAVFAANSKKWSHGK